MSIARTLTTLTLFIFAGRTTHAEPMYRMLAGGNVVEGTRLVWTKDYGALLARDGRWFNLDPTKVEGLREVSNTFRPYSAAEFRTLLQQEFGSAFEVTGDAHYLVVHPAGQRDAWAPRFEELYRSFQQYFTSRGWRPAEPAFPLVAVVFPNERAFRQVSAAEGSNVPPGTLGYYSPLTNRILLYDITKSTSLDWSVNAETIVHEAAHQIAFNTGIHNRFAQPSRWIAEGLGTMFEARGVWNSLKYKAQTDRVNRYRFQAFTNYAKTRRKPGALGELVASDRLFQSDPDAAYAEAWALSFYLCETDPRRYLEYLRKTAAQPNFTQRRAPERLADFSAVFGDNYKLTEAKMLRFMSELK